MTERMSKAMLDGVGLATGSVMVPIVRSRAGKAFLTMVPGEVLMVSLDAVSKYKLDLSRTIYQMYIYITINILVLIQTN